MMMRSLLLLLAFVSSAVAFAPSASTRVFSVAKFDVRPAQPLFMSSEEQPSEETKISADGTYFDDEVEPVQKVGISDSMKERLMREASTGLDADKKQTNVILYISVGVALLVILGGGGILY